jgi:energy-coupling factor transporter ATP-binding protein EcfA2
MKTTLAPLNSRMSLTEQSKEQWLATMKKQWIQGEHVALIGPTGTGKTSLAHPLLEIRDYVCILALKKKDETLDRFKQGPQWGFSRYKVIDYWPADYPTKRVVFWPKPKDLGAGDNQSERVYKVFNYIYIAGGWCLFIDDAGYVAGSLGLGRALGTLLNQGRSANISIMAAMTRPSSVIAQVPKEAFNQCRHVLIFRYSDEREIKTCASIAGVPFKDMVRYQEALQWRIGRGGKRYSDFLSCYDGKVTIVRNA